MNGLKSRGILGNDRQNKLKNNVNGQHAIFDDIYPIYSSIVIKYITKMTFRGELEMVPDNMLFIHEFT